MVNPLDDDDIPAAGRKVKKNDNSKVDASGVAADQLRSILERVERLDADKKAIADDIKEVYGEAKSNGFDVKILRKIVAMRRRDAAEREEEAAILELYLSALGMPF